MADNERSRQEDVPQYGGDETVKVWSSDLQPERTSLSKTANNTEQPKFI